MKIEQLKKDVYWLGVLDNDLEVFDIIMETKYGTTYNAYLVNTSEGAVLIETVKEKFFDEYLEKIKGIIGDLNNVKYIITNHTEPDHSGSIGRFVELYPDTVVVGSKTAISYLKDLINIEFKSQTTESLKQLTVGDKTFKFIPAPFLHWPDSIYTLLETDDVLFTCDSFGSHYCPKHGIRLSEVTAEEEEGFQDALLYYYTAIFSPFKKYVLKAVDKIKPLNFNMVCTGHGPVLDTRIDEIINTYKTWSEEAPKSETKKVVIPYVSAYGYTTELTNLIKQGIKDVDSSIEILDYDINILNYPTLKGDILTQFADADGILFGTSTINGDALPLIWDLAINLNPIVHGGKVVSVFGSYGWSGEGVDNIIDRLNQLRMHVLDGFKIKFKASPEEQKAAFEFGRLYASCLLDGKVPYTKKTTASAIVAEDINPSGEIMSWRCIICDEVYEGVVPPEVCPACGVGAELFEPYVKEEITFNVATEESFVIVGAGVAAVSAAEAIRARNEVATITLVSTEADYPYYRPAVSDYVIKDVENDFYLHEQNWYAEQNINVLLNTTVTEINSENQQITLQNGETLAYDKLILATGATPFIPSFENTNLGNVFTMKTKQDAVRVREAAQTTKKAVVIGGGVLGLEAADALNDLGVSVTVVEYATHVMPRQLDVEAGQFMKDILASKNIELLTDTAVRGLVGTDTVSGVQLNDTILDADLVVINTGVRPNIELAISANITCDRGIIVNEHMQTSVANIYACGDVAQFESNIPALWAPAISQGKTAGTHAVGDEASYTASIEPLTFVGLDTNVFSIGAYPTEDVETYHVFKDYNPTTQAFKKLYFKDNQLVYGVLFKDITKANALLMGVRNGHDSHTVLAKLFS